MKTLQRQDDSLVTLTDEDAAKWLKLGIGTLPPEPVKPEKTTKPVDDKGAVK